LENSEEQVLKKYMLNRWKKVIAHNFIHMIRKEEAAKKLLKVS